MISLLDKKAKTYLRDIAKQLKEAASEDHWAETKRLWMRKNALKKTRPLILCTLPAEAWEELVTVDDCRTDDPFIRGYELFILRQLYRAEHLKDDEVIEPVLYAPYFYRFSDWFEGRQRPYSGNRFRSEAFHPVIVEYRDVKKLRKPELTDVDEKKSREGFDILEDLFGGILDIKPGLPTTSDTDSLAKGWGWSAIDILCEFRGLQNLYMDFILAPDFIHETMEFITQGILEYKKTVYENGWLALNNMSYVRAANTPLGSNGLSISDELPGPDFSGIVRYSDLWGYSEAQELSEVSPDMHLEFVLPYQKRLTDDFGLLSYGCCESNDKKWDNIFNTFKNLREVSVSHAANLEIAAEKIGTRYVLCWKPHCGVIATYDENVIRNQLKKGFETLKDCHMVCCLRDNITLFGYPERVSRWTEIAMELARDF